MTDETIQPLELEGAALTQHINNLSGRVLRGELVSDAEIAAAVLALRTQRKFASEASPARAKKKQAASIPLDLNALFETKPSAKPADAESLDLNSLFSGDK